MYISFQDDELQLFVGIDLQGRMIIQSGRFGTTTILPFSTAPQGLPQGLPLPQGAAKRKKQTRKKIKFSLPFDRDNVCSVCMDEMSTTRVVYTAGCDRHLVCGGCFRGMTKHNQDGKCPVCRTEGEFKKVTNWKLCVSSKKK